MAWPPKTAKTAKTAKTTKTAKATRKKEAPEKTAAVPEKTAPSRAKPTPPVSYPKLGSSVVTPDGHTAVVVKHKIRRAGPMVLCKLSDGSTHLHKLSEVKLA